MSRRRRLALRQIEEPSVAAALSGLEDEHKHDDAVAEEPNFDLLGMMAAEEVPRTEAAPFIHIDDDDDPMGETQIIDAADGFRTPVKKQRVGGGSASTAPADKEEMAPTLALTDAVSGVFQLYQTGLCADHTLRLHYIRRKPPPPKAIPVEETFVLPRPRLCALDVLPPLSVSIRDVVGSENPSIDHEPATDTKCSLQQVHELVKSASSYWRQIDAVPEELIVSWRSLQECEWQEVYSKNDSSVPDPDSVVRLLETLHSDAFAAFAWRELLAPTLRNLVADAAASATIARLAASLLGHAHFQHLSAKDFRAQLRGMNLRAVDPSLGAATELMVVTQFHKYRDKGV